MRAKVLATAVSLAVGIVCIALYFKFVPLEPEPAPAPAPAAEVATAAAPAQPVPAAVHRVAAPANSGNGVAVPEKEEEGQTHEEFVRERQAELTQLGMSDDPEDLKVILTELNNKDPEIRRSALTASVQFGSKDAIPALQNEMAWAEDPEEKVALMKAIQFLQLPKFQDLQAGTETPAAGNESAPGQ